MINAVYPLRISTNLNCLFRTWIIVLYFLQGCPQLNTGMASLIDRSDMILRTAFFLLSPHTPDKSGTGGNANSLDKQTYGHRGGGGSGSTGEGTNGAGESGESGGPGLSNYFEQGSDSEELLKYYKMPMQFGTENYTLVTSQIGSTAHVPCRIHHIGEGVVSWIRRKDYHLLTVGLTTYSSDERFSATHLQNSEDWTLQIKFVQDRDAGLYECQVSTHPPTSIFLELKVVEARAEIVGPQVKYLTPDSTLKLICRVVQSTEASAFIFWYHNNRMINYDLDRGINVSTEADFHYSELTISQASKEHSGNYTCVPSNSQPASVVVHIFKGDNPAAMYHEHRSSSTIPYRDRLEMLRLLAFLMVLLFVRYWRETDLTERVAHRAGTPMKRENVPTFNGAGRLYAVASDRRTHHVPIYTDTDNHQHQALHQTGCHLTPCF
uniref:Ig-like domain-containing protein n=1 Tax=Anopheles funestus TaxID=62324 RepID=A0A4Y0BIW0_ANOFN